MIKKIKMFLEYRKNKMIVKRETVKLLSSALSTLNDLAEKSTDIAKLILTLADAVQNTEDDSSEEE